MALSIWVVMENMRKLLCLIMAVASCGVTKAMTEEDAISALEGFGDKCDPVPDEQDYRDIIQNSENVRRSTECFRLCLMDQLKLLVDCKLDPMKVKDLVGMVIEGKDEETTNIVDICNAKVTCEDKCKAAHNFAMCIWKESKQRKWPLPELEKKKSK